MKTKKLLKLFKKYENKHNAAWGKCSHPHLELYTDGSGELMFNDDSIFYFNDIKQLIKNLKQ